MKRFGWVRAAELTKLQDMIAAKEADMIDWANEVVEKHEREYRELAERWAETREHLFDRKQLQAIQNAVLEYRLLMPPAPILVKEKDGDA
jgi:enoyl-CoA hydratase/carnithine racemase